MNELKSMVISVPDARLLFLGKDGLPKMECLYTLDNICERLGKPIPEEQPWHSYVRNFDTAVMGAVKKYFIARHTLFIAPKIETTVYYGFSKKQDMVENYMSRLNGFAKSYKTIERKTKLIAEGQFDLFNKLT
jgi:hypothetical protein